MPELTEPHRRGTLKIFLGYAAGVGKTYQMLDEAQKLKLQGTDLVVGYFEPHGRQDTIAKARGLEFVPRHNVAYRSSTFEEMDTDAILRRHPKVCAVDEFAHTNVPGSERAKRWEDVQVLLDAGIHVLTTMNVQHLESLNDQVWHFTGVRVRETIPDWVVKQADEVVMVDLPPQALLNRLKRGAVYSRDKARLAAEKFFTESNLVALRELAMRQTAHEVDVRHAAQEEIQPPGKDSDDRAAPPTFTPIADRILIFITDDPSTAALVRRGRRVADYLQADCFAVFIYRQPDLSRLPKAQRERVERHLNFARNLHIETRVLQGDNVAQTLVNFARLHRVTQIFLARPRLRSWPRFFHRNLLGDVVRLARDMQVTIVAERRRNQPSPRPVSE